MNLEQSNFVELHKPCPCGKSSDAFCINKDGSGKCFSCNEFFPGERKKLEGKESFKYIPHRGISDRTMRFYDIQVKCIDDVPLEVGFKYPSGGFKVRSFDEKKFRTEGPMREAGLFGRDKFDAGSKDSITITEGEYDAASIYDALFGKTAAVSIRGSSSALRDCIADREFINSFGKIYICFDNDEPGQKAAKEVSSLFDFTKVYHVKFTKYKDANDYLQHNEADDLKKIWENAKRYTPDNIISSFSDIEKTLEESKEDEIGTYPFTSLQTATYGLHRGEIIVFKGPTGIGKTEVFRAIEHHLLKTTKSNLGIIHLEEDNATTIKALAGYELEVPATLPDCGLSKRDILEGYKKAVKDDDGRVHIYSSFDLEDEATLLDNIRFLVTAAGCDFIFLDHISWLATGLEKEDGRLKLDRLSQKFKMLCKELRFCLIMISHTNDEGRTRDSRNIENVANTMIHLTRDKEAVDDVTKRTTFMTLNKVRLGGHTGPAGRAVFDTVSGKLKELQQQDLVRIPV